MYRRLCERKWRGGWWCGNKGGRMCESAVLSGMRDGYGEYTGKWSAAHCIQLGGLEGNSHQTLFWDICHVFDGFICSKTAPYPRPRCLSIAPFTAPLLSSQTKFAVGQTTRLENITPTHTASPHLHFKFEHHLMPPKISICIALELSR